MDLSARHHSRWPSDDQRGLVGVVTRGVVERGDQRGRSIGFPTANLALEQGEFLDGVWAGWVEHDGYRDLAAVSIGNRPTFYGAVGFRLLEAHLLDFSGDLYGRTITVTLWHKLRNQVRFDSVDDLVNQLRHDVARCRQLARDRHDAALSHDLVDIPLGLATALTAAG